MCAERVSRLLEQEGLDLPILFGKFYQGCYGRKKCCISRCEIFIKIFRICRVVGQVGFEFGNIHYPFLYHFFINVCNKLVQI